MQDDTPTSHTAAGPVDELRQQQLMATAYHEAGHAVMAICLGRPIHKVTIRPGRSEMGAVRLGVCQLQKGRAKSSNDVLEDEVLILYAGMVAEARFTGQYCRQGAAQDLMAIRRLLCTRANTPAQFERLQRRMLDKAEHLMDDGVNVRAVDLLAQELVEKTTISGRAVRHFYHQAKCQN